ncbi:MAG: hypothetical protein HPY83_18220 [Anaerolineae bacterium]|nr:hypothetical protein [Anaerolineae bacterium]
MFEGTITRRSFLRVAGLASTAGVMVACGASPQPAPTQEPEATAVPVSEATVAPAPAETAPVSKYSEAPSLAAKVAAGELPPVEERLPAEPFVVECYHEVGQYSGDLRRTLTGPTDLTGNRVILWDNFARWDYRTGRLEPIPNMVTGWDISPDGKTYTFRLRRGMKWSDGEPFTADDILFWQEAIALNKELSPSYPSWLTSGGRPPAIEKIDDYTVSFTFEVPHGILIETLCFRGSDLIAPKHYLSQFHPDYADADELAAKVKAANFEHWYELFANRRDDQNNPDLPVLWAWKVEQPFPGERMVLVRNPYYWKVDTEGKQLPYFDRLINELSSNNEMCLMRAIAGEIDLQYRHLGFSDYSLLVENEENGNYTILEWQSPSTGSTVYVNQSYGDLGLREVFQNRDFRYGLSHGINRDEMNDLFWYGMATPYNPAGSPADPHWVEGYGSTALEYDVDLANEYLDKAGLDRRDGDGFRLRPDGERLQLLLECYPSEEGGLLIDIFSQVAAYWRELGIEATAKEIERSLWAQRAQANECMMPSYGCAGLNWILDPTWYVPYGSCYWGPLFAQWAINHEAGEEPPPLIREIIEWYEQLKSEPDPEKRLELGRRILGRHNEELFIIGTCRIGINPCLAKNDMVNVLEDPPADYRSHHEGITWPFQVWRRGEQV